MPLLPYGVVNYSAGLTHLSYTSMAVGTLIGAAPKVFVYTALGGSLDDLTSPEALVALALLGVLGLGGASPRRQAASAGTRSGAARPGWRTGAATRVARSPSPAEAACCPRPLTRSGSRRRVSGCSRWPAPPAPLPFSIGEGKVPGRGR